MGSPRRTLSPGFRTDETLTSVDDVRIVTRAAAAVGLRHAGIDLLRTARGPRVMEVNACPDFSSMQPCYDEDLGALVVAASLGEGGRVGPPSPRS